MAFRLGNLEGRAVLLQDEHYYDLKKVSHGRLPADPMEVLARHDEVHDLTDLLEEAQPEGRIDEVELGPPVPRPSKVFGIGLNYKAHAEETGRGLPEVPLVFTKYPSCLVGPTSTIELRGDHTDWEVELVAVIGVEGRDIPESEGWDSLAGLMVGQDISDRKVQTAGQPAQFSLGKSFDTYGPTGPAVVSLDQLEDPGDLAIKSTVSGEEKQQARTSDLIFSVPYLVSYLSAITTVFPGDLIFTGTPSGVGAPTKTFLRDGDIVESEIEGLGKMRNPCVKV